MVWPPATPRTTDRISRLVSKSSTIPERVMWPPLTLTWSPSPNWRTERLTAASNSTSFGSEIYGFAMSHLLHLEKHGYLNGTSHRRVFQRRPITLVFPLANWAMPNRVTRVMPFSLLGPSAPV